MSIGIITVAFGDHYDRLAAHAFLYSRKFTDLPVFVLTNIPKEKRHKTWDHIPGVQFMEFNKPQSKNRKAKLHIVNFTPFEKTLYMDCDSVVQNKGVELFADLLNDKDMVFNPRITFEPGQKIANIYARCMKQFGVSKPISIHNGGLFAFKKNETTLAFFKQWFDMWSQFGAGREMPPLNCAIKKSGMDFNKFPQNYFADNHYNPDAIVQHSWHRESFAKQFSVPVWEEYKPFDKGQEDDFRLERNPT